MQVFGYSQKFLIQKELLSKLTKNKVDPHSFPPTSFAGTLHYLRAYHTVQERIGNKCDPKKYGFYEHESSLETISYEGPLVPEKLTKTILCNWKKSACKSGNCLCKSFGLYFNEGMWMQWMWKRWTCWPFIIIELSNTLSVFILLNYSTLTFINLAKIAIQSFTPLSRWWW